MSSLHAKLHLEADKIRKWKNQTEYDIKQKVEFLLLCIKLKFVFKLNDISACGENYRLARNMEK